MAAAVLEHARVPEDARGAGRRRSRRCRGCRRPRGRRPPWRTGRTLERKFQATHTMDEQIRPTRMAPVPLTHPAQGVIPTRPQIMPFTAPRKVGFFSLETQASQATQVSRPAAVARLVLTTAPAASGSGVVRVTTVEAVPAEPQDAGADRRHDQVVGQEVLSVSEEPGPEDPGGHETGDTGRHVDDVPAREVERTLLGEVAAAPQQEGVDRVDAGRPQRHQEAPGAELDPPEHAPEEEQRGDGREHQLEVRQRRRREVEGDDGVGRRHRLALFALRTGDRPRLAR